MEIYRVLRDQPKGITCWSWRRKDITDEYEVDGLME